MSNVVIQAIGVLALLIYLVSYQLRDGRRMILCRILADAVNIGHYLLLGAFSGCGTLVICVLNGLICGNRTHAWAQWKGWKWLMSLALVVICIATRQGSHPWLTSACTLISILGVVWTQWSGKGWVMRLGKVLVVGPFWIIYCIFFGSIPGIINECIGMASAIVPLVRYGCSDEKTSNLKEK